MEMHNFLMKLRLKSAGIIGGHQGMTNQEVANLLRQIAKILEIKGTAPLG